jgi:hypothetical protein
MEDTSTRRVVTSARRAPLLAESSLGAPLQPCNVMADSRPQISSRTHHMCNRSHCFETIENWPWPYAKRELFFATSIIPNTRPARQCSHSVQIVHNYSAAFAVPEAQATALNP